VRGSLYADADLMYLVIFLVAALVVYLFNYFTNRPRSAKEVVNDTILKELEYTHKVRMGILHVAEQFSKKGMRWRVLAIQSQQGEAHFAKMVDGFHVMCTVRTLENLTMVYTLKGERINEIGTALITLPKPFAMASIDADADRLIADTRRVTQALLLTPTFSLN
jgi:hypothetical protein